MIEQLMIYHHLILGKMYVDWITKLGNGNQQQSRVDVQNLDHISFNSQMDHQDDETESKEEQQKHPVLNKFILMTTPLNCKNDSPIQITSHTREV